MTGDKTALHVYLGELQVATLSVKQDNLEWRYTSDWLEKGYPVSPHLPLEGSHSSVVINRFLRNMLPEGHAFDELIESIHVSRSNTFALVRALGLDTPGALVLRVKASTTHDEGAFRPLSSDELGERLNQRDTRSLIIWDEKPRLSVAGVQDKLNLVIMPDGEIGFGEGALCSTHILKFEPRGKINLVLNEYLTMRLARRCGLQVANIEMRQFGDHQALLVERFDRRLLRANKVERRHMIDGCQALNLPPESKYEQNFGSGRDVSHIRDGASLPRLFDFASLCTNPALTKQQMLDWVLFNAMVFNVDAHGKNISFFVGRKGIALAPFYDLVNIKLYSHVEQNMAMAFGDEFECDHINAYQIADFAVSCNLNRRYVVQRLKNLIDAMKQALSSELKAWKADKKMSYFVEQYQAIITRRCMHFEQQLSDIPSIEL